ncbi:MAG: Prevent-host-death protein antitoxin of system [Modestobacter sp.]|nr:Prevent-host-death protein antitoxin of system [Modestobacter sp.]
MAAPRHFDSFTDARKHFRRVLDAAHEGVVTTVTRDKELFVVLTADARGAELRRLLHSEAVVVSEGGGWAAFIPGVPVHGDADTFDDAIDDLIAGLREYAEDWNERLHAAPNHAGHRSLVELVELSDDAQLREWLVRRTDAVKDAARALVSS